MNACNGSQQAENEETGQEGLPDAVGKLNVSCENLYL